MQSGLVLGTRGSNLAMAQAHIAAARLKQADSSLTIEIRKIITTGDRDQRASLSEIGGKGVFIKELEQALLGGVIDVAVHSFKDITTQVPTGLELCAFFCPESVGDVLVSRDNVPLEQLPDGAQIGTGSMRRRVLLSRLRPDVRFIDIRGNIDTRMARLDQGMCDGVVLAEAGLIRLGLEKRVTQRFDPRTFFPAPGQGVIALEIRQQDKDISQRCLAAGDEDQRVISCAELSVLDCLGFDCRTPLGVYTQLADGILGMSGFYVHPHTDDFIEQRATGPASAPQELGRILGRMLLEGRK
jgi:hydroxymethylbilane synthase